MDTEEIEKKLNDYLVKLRISSASIDPKRDKERALGFKAGYAAATPPPSPEGLRWVKASERLPEVIIYPMLSGGFDKGSNRVFFKYKGEVFAGRYIEEKMSFKNVFVTSEMDSVILSSEFEYIEWLEETPTPVKEDEWDDIFKAGFHSNNYTLTEYLKTFYNPPTKKIK